MKIEFILPTYNRPAALMCSIASLTAQTNPNWTCNVVCDGYWDDEYEKIKSFYASNPKIKWTMLETNYKDWGHTPRNIGMKMATEEWVIMGGDDNYYCPVFVDDFLKAVTPDTNFVFCDMVHNWNANQYIPVMCQPKVCKIDVGCFMCRTKMAQQMEIEVKHKELADGIFVEKYIAKFKGDVQHIKKLLYVHN